MADCSKFDILYQNHLNTFNAINGSVDSTKSDGLSRAARLDVAGAESVVRQLDNYSRQLGTLISEIAKLEYAADDAGCKGQADKFLSLLDRAEELESKVGDAEADVNDAISDAEDKIQEAEDAAAQKKQDELDSLEEVQVTGKKAPDPVTGSTGPTGASAESGTGATGPQPVVDDPAIPTDAGPIDIGTDPNINLGEDPPQPEGSSQGLDGATTDAQQGASRQDAIEFARAGDWRVRLALAPNAKYLYDVKQGQNAGILAPLRVTDGVIFPYTPNISISYAASYEPTSVTHSNYKIFQYQNSSVDNISISCDFTAQDTYEANYLLAVIHFFRTVTKMFYGQDQNPKAGTPPPLCYLYGLGQFQFNAHPLVITNFAYNLPTDVDYIRADSVITDAIDVSSGNTPTNTTPDPSSDRLAGADASLAQGGTKAPPVWRTVPSGTTEPTYVPTKINLQITAVPVVSRNDISNRFSVKKYATGELLKGIDNPTSGGIW